MTIDVSNGRRFSDEPVLDELTEASAILLLHTSTGVKSITVEKLRDFLQGKISDLTTEDKTSVVAAINELVTDKTTDEDAIKALQEVVINYPGAMAANALPVEMNLGSSYTDEQSADVKAGKFQKVRTGGYWTINGTKYWAGHADYRLHCGDTELTKHHMLVFPDKSLYDAKMNDTDITTGAYYGSALKTSRLADALAKVKNDFGASHVLSCRVLLANGVANGASSSWAWYDSQIDLMNQAMVYGHVAWAGNGYDVGTDKTQLAIFQARPDLICNRQNWWLRDVRSSANFCGVNYDGDANGWGASHSFGVRPAFLIA